jgi:hypothetical protein
LEADDDGQPRWEGLLARRLAADRVRVCAVPVFAYDVNLGDEIRVIESEEGALVAAERLRDAGSVTFRVWLPEHDGSGDDQRWRTLLRELGRYGCWLDVYSPRLIAISAGPDVAGPVADDLVARERRGDLVYETGRTLKAKG